MYIDCENNKLLYKSVNSFHASFAIGLEIGYTQKPIKKEDVFSTVQNWQKEKINKEGIYLSASITECNIVLSSQNESHLKFDFINYPKSKLTKKDFKRKVIELSEYLMHEFGQNRLIIEFTDETLMLEYNKNIDPRI